MPVSSKHLAAPALAGLAIVSSLPPASAQDQSRQGPGNFVALGAGAGPEYLGSEDFAARPFVAGRVDAGYAVFELRGLTATADVLGPQTNGAFSGGPLVSYRFGRDDVENDVVDQLDDVDAAVELGGFVAYNLPWLASPTDALSFRLEAAFDVSDGHGGFVLTPSAAYSIGVTQRLRTTFAISATYADESFNDSFFSVDADGAVNSGLDTFEAGEGFYRAGLSVGANYAITQRWGLTGVVSYSRLIGDAADSPIVDDEGEASQLFGGVGALYRF